MALSSVLLLRCVHLKEARQAYEAKEYQTAEKLLKAVIISDSINADAYLLLSKTYLAMDKLQPASESIQQAMAFGTGSGKITQAHTHIRIKLGSRLKALGKEQRAIIQFKSAEPYDSTHYELVNHIADLYLQMGILDKASIRYCRLASLYPDSTKAKTMLAKIETRSQKAETFYKRACWHLEKINFKLPNHCLRKHSKKKRIFTMPNITS